MIGEREKINLSIHRKINIIETKILENNTDINANTINRTETKEENTLYLANNNKKQKRTVSL